MQFDPKTKAWIILIMKTIGTALGIGYTAFLTGSHWIGASVVGISSAFMQIQSQLADSPSDKAEKEIAKTRSAAPFAVPTAPKVP